MSKPNGVVAAFMLLLFLTSVVSPKLVVSGSSVHDDEDHEHGFKRPDPLRFKYYSGGYNVTNKHYWAVSYMKMHFVFLHVSSINCARLVILIIVRPVPLPLTCKKLKLHTLHVSIHQVGIKVINLWNLKLRIDH